MRSAPAIRARIFSYLYYGLKRFNMHAVVEIVPLLLHVSLLFFFAGLVAFLIPVNAAITAVAAALLAIVAGIYSLLTVLPLLSLDCPYRTPLSGVLWNLVQSFIARHPDSDSGQQNTASREPQTMVESMFRRATEISDERSARDKKALLWTMKSLADDVELEPFIEAIPDVLWGPYSRRHVYDDHIYTLIHTPEVQLLDRLHLFFLSSGSGILTAEAERRWRITSHRALWAILSVYDATDPSKPLPLLHELSYQMSSSDPAVDHYKCSTTALLQ
ncbi:hypothetical protein B0H10DRAFT_2318475, partial [Mycena sp. CBHHK59/15]